MSPLLTIQTPAAHLHHRFYCVEANGDGLDRAGTVADPAF